MATGNLEGRCVWNLVAAKKLIAGGPVDKSVIHCADECNGYNKECNGHRPLHLYMCAITILSINKFASGKPTSEQEHFCAYECTNTNGQCERYTLINIAKQELSAA